MDATKKKSVRSIITVTGVLAALTALVVGGVQGGRQLWASSTGGQCNEDLGCQPNHVCISKRCRHACGADADCQTGWTCRPTKVSVTRGKTFSLDAVNICFSPEAMAPALAREHANEVEAAKTEKKKDVRRQVIVEAMMKEQLTDDEFERGWSAIPRAEQEAATVNALAARVVRTMRPNVAPATVPVRARER